MSTLRIVSLVAAGMVLSACGSTPPTTGQDSNGAAVEHGATVELQNGSIAPVSFSVGLNCDAYDTTLAGGLSCDWDGFTQPETWDKVGSIEVQDSIAGTVELVRFKDGHVCVTLDGNQSGAITCSYPAR